MRQKLKTVSIGIIGFSILILIVFFPLVSGSAVMKWDAMDLYLPWKFFITETLAEGYLPLWNPSMNGGFPQMGDPGTWYPISWLIAWIGGGYSIYSTQIEYLLHLLIAGAGMYVFVYSRLKNIPTALIIGCAFMFSGVFIGNAQHIGWIVGGAWIPWIFWCYGKWINGSRIAVILLALMLFFQLTGGYPAIFFITCYILLILFFRDVFKMFQTKSFSKSNTIRQVILFFVCFIALSGIVLYSSFDMAQHVNRGGGLSGVGHWTLLDGSLTTPSLLSFVVPFAAAKNDQSVWGLDFSMVNVFIGVFVLLAIFSRLAVKEANHKIRINFFIAVLFFLIALGEIFPFRTWIAYLPLLDYFRFPSLFRLFGDFFLLLAGAYAIHELLTKDGVMKLFVKWLIGFLLIAIPITFYLIAIIERWRFLELMNSGWLHFYETSGVKELAVFQLLIVIGLTLALVLTFFLKRQWFKTVFIVVVLFELSIATWLNRDGTVMQRNSIDYALIGLEKSPDRFEVPHLLPMSEFENGKYQPNFKHLWRNLPIYMKVPSHDGHSPYSLTIHKEASLLGFDTIMNKQPVVFLCPSIHNHLVQFDDEFNEKKHLSVTSFKPNEVKLNVRLSTSGYVVFNQNYYPHWKVQVDGKNVPLERVNINYMSVFVAKGNHEVVFLFNPPYIKVLWYTMIVSLGIFVVVLIIYGLRKIIRE